MEAQNYNVEFDKYSERHYIKSFAKRYKSAWDVTRDDLVEVCRRIDGMLEYQRADLIAANAQYKLIKLNFAIAGLKQSPKNSGNRCILVVDEDIRSVRVLLVYSKNDISSPNETSKWKTVIREQFPEYAQTFSM